MKRFFKFIADFIKSRPYAAFLLAWPCQFVWYGVLNSSQTYETSHIMHVALDDSIPLEPLFLIPYALWYVYVAGALVFSLWKSKKAFFEMCSATYSSMFIPLIIATVYPSWHDLRVPLGDSLLEKAIGYLWTLDNPAVIFPSMHVLVSVMVTAAFFRADYMKGHYILKITAAVFTLFVAASTVLVKQHSIIDVFFAFALAVPIYFFAFYFIPKITRLMFPGNRVKES